MAALCVAIITIVLIIISMSFPHIIIFLSHFLIILGAHNVYYVK